MFEKTKEKLELKRLEKEKKTLEEEKKALEERQISIKDLYVVRIGKSQHISEYRYAFVPSKRIAITVKKSKFKYIDIFSDIGYFRFSDEYHDDGDLYCDELYPFASYLNPIGELSKQVLSQGWIYYKDLVEMYSRLNDFINGNNKSERDDNSNNENKNNSIAGYLLNDKVYDSEPAFERNKEVNEVITSLAGLKKSPLLVGLSGVGKTTIVEELVYKIQNDDVPRFLKDKKIVEVDISNIISGTNYRGDLEKNFEALVNYAIKNNAILFIDEIHRIVGAGATSKDDNDISEMLKKVMDRDNIKVIGTTTEDEYNKYFSDNALKRRFDRIDIKEPSNKDLRIIIEKVFKNYSSSFEISLDNINYILDQIIEILINLTSKDSRNQMDIENNPSLVIGIIDKAFSDARVNSEDNLSIDNIITAIASSSRIYEMSREKAISKLKLIEPKSMKLYNDNVVKFSNKEKD